MFAYTNEVNFLSAGANSPSVGSGGTGIWQGTFNNNTLSIKNN